MEKQDFAAAGRHYSDNCRCVSCQKERAEQRAADRLKSPAPIEKPEYVEVPIDPKYITEDGFYVAGYRCGQRGQSPKDWQYDAPDAPEIFHMGVNDGYNDWLAKFRATLETRTKEIEEGIV